jgi:ribosomal protein L11 methyltransferase
MAFGTVHNPTTSLFLVAMEDYVKDHAVVFDIGTGSGILAVAAAKLALMSRLATLIPWREDCP